MPRFQFYLWYGVLAPASTPPNVVARSNNELACIAALTDVKEMLRAQAVELATGPSHEFVAFLTLEVAHWNEVIEETGLHLN